MVFYHDRRKKTGSRRRNIIKEDLVAEDMGLGELPIGALSLVLTSTFSGWLPHSRADV